MCKWFKKWCLPIIGFSVVTAVWWYFGGYEKAMANGTDKFDSLNSLFAGLAFVGMLCTLFMQKQELELQRQELSETRKEIQRTREATEKMATAARNDNFFSVLDTLVTRCTRVIEDRKQEIEKIIASGDREGKEKIEKHRNDIKKKTLMLKDIGNIRSQILRCKK